MLMRFKDAPEAPPPGMVAPGSEDKVMHASLRIGETTVMASDGQCLGQPGFQGFSLSITATDEARSEEHTSELQSLMRISYAVFCLKKKKEQNHRNTIRIKHMITI